MATLNLKHEVPAAGFADSSTPLDWKNIWIIKFGAEYRINDGFALRGGYAYVTTPVPEHTLDPGNPASTQHNVSVGSLSPGGRGLGEGVRFESILL
jgi:long-chain fatty acid transport protein